MLGSVHDAEAALQDAPLRAWRGRPRSAGRSSLRSWLYRIATNACLDVIARRPKRVLPIDYEPLEEQAWVEPYPDAPDATYEQRESMERSSPRSSTWRLTSAPR
jgi:RNA polymerase sigma-70 factor (ECF subfamily)